MTTTEATSSGNYELTVESKIEMLRRMLRIRLLDEAAIELVSRGLLPGPMHTSIGQEGEIVGACMALRDTDYMLGNHRSHGHPIGKGGKVGPLLAELLGKATGVCRGKGGSQHLADFSVGSLGESGIVAAGMPIATGAALSARLRGTDQVALAFFGDGAANSGPFHEAHNLAATWRLPVIFMCENNGYAVRTAQRESTSVKDIAQRAAAYDIPGVIVDGQDVLAVHEVVSAAVARARAGEGPTLIDAKTYRYRDHAEFGSMALRLVTYRDESEVEEWKQRDPIVLFRRHLLSEGLLTEHSAQELTEQIRAEIDEGVQFALDSPYPEPSDAYEDLYANPIPIRGVSA
jgi:pyruvate dehydrogenase E1 component alpha subunit